MRSVRIAAAAGIVAAGLALGAAGIAQAAPNSAPAPVTPKAVQVTKAAAAKPAPVKAAPSKAKVYPISQARAAQAKRLAEAEAAKARAAHKTTHKAATRANYRVTASRLNVRSGPSVHDRRVGSLARGAHVTAGTAVVNGFRELSAGHWVSVHYLAPVR